jgi:hypothetical protein
MTENMRPTTNNKSLLCENNIFTPVSHALGYNLTEIGKTGRRGHFDPGAALKG